VRVCVCVCDRVLVATVVVCRHYFITVGIRPTSFLGIMGRAEMVFCGLTVSFSGSKGGKTFKPVKNLPEGTRQRTLQEKMMKTLGSGNLRLAVKLPEGEDENEWIAVNTVDFFNQLNMLYGTLTEFCTPVTCPVMSAGPKYEYLWADGVKYKKPIKCCACEYVDYMMTWVQSQLDNEEVFPSRMGVPFPKNFITVCRTILKRLFRVYAHIYHAHFEKVCQLEEERHLNTSFKHFTFFVTEFGLVDRRELAPMEELIALNLKESGGAK